MRRIVGLLVLCWAAGSLGAADQRPNVLLVIVDDLRDTLGCYGHPTAKTPHVDRLAARGVRFERAYVQYPICNPSRCSFLTGLRPERTGIVDNRTLLRDRLPDVITWPQWFRQHGWYTASVGKVFHLGGGRDPARRAQWMDVERSWDEAHVFQPTQLGRQAIAGRNLTGGQLTWCRWAMAAGGDDDQPDGQNARAAVQLIDRLGDRPWMIAVGLHKPHDPFIAPKKYFDLYPPDSLTLYRDPPHTTPAPPLAVGFGAFGQAFRRFGEQEQLEFLRAYLACTSFMDAQVGRLLDVLDRRRLWDRTIVVFTSDHGYHLGERQWWNKNTLFERSCRVPLIVAAPGVRPGVARGIVELIDLLPTVAELCDLPPPSGYQGQSFRRLLMDPQRDGKEFAWTMVMRGTERGDSLRTDRWRYTQWSDGQHELYDHAADPEETRNVAAEHAEIVKRLAQQLAQLRSAGR